MNCLCAAAQRTGSCAFVLIVFGLAQSALFVPAVAAEELGDDEVSIGTFTLSPQQTKPRSDAPSALLEDSNAKRPAVSTSPAAPSESRTVALFDDALAALDAGRNADAQRLFERIIAEAPDSALAKDARGHLAELYKGAMRSTAERRTTTAARDGDASRLPPVTEIPRLGGSAVPDEPDRSQGTEVSAAIEERFIAEAGDRVFFSAGSAELGSRARGVLQAQARFIKLRPDLAATIEGHADDGALSADENLRLSEARADAVRQRLIEEGIESNRLSVNSWGRDKRVSDCPDPACAAQNRRVVTVLVSAPARRTDGPASVGPGEAAVVARDQSLLTH